MLIKCIFIPLFLVILKKSHKNFLHTKIPQGFNISIVIFLLISNNAEQ